MADKGSNSGAASPDAPNASPVPSPAADLAALIREAVEAAVAPYRAELSQMRAGQPRFVRLPPNQQRRQRTYVPPEELRKKALRGIAKGQNAAGQTRWLDTPEGRKGLPPEYWPLFGPGDLVRLNPDALVWGGEGKVWADFLPSITGNTEGIGEIVGTMQMTETWEPKYKVQIRGFSNGASGFRESELLPYEPEYGIA